jgi:hypothetical protein
MGQNEQFAFDYANSIGSGAGNAENGTDNFGLDMLFDYPEFSTSAFFTEYDIGNLFADNQFLGNNPFQGTDVPGGAGDSHIADCKCPILRRADTSGTTTCVH